MVQEIHDQRKIVAAAKVGFKRAAGNQVVAIRNSHGLRIGRRNFEHVLPIGCVDVSGGILFCDGDVPKDAVPCGNIEDFADLAALADFGSHQFSGHMHERHHGPRKLHPVGILGGQSSFTERCASTANRFGEARMGFAHALGKQKFYCAAQVCRRMLVEEQR